MKITNIAICALFFLNFVFSIEKERITPDNFFKIHQEICDVAYNLSLQENENKPQMKMRLHLSYLANISACGHHPGEAEKNWSLRGFAKISNNILNDFYLKELQEKYDYEEVMDIFPHRSFDEPKVHFKNDQIVESLAPTLTQQNSRQTIEYIGEYLKSLSLGSLIEMLTKSA